MDILSNRPNILFLVWVRTNRLGFVYTKLGQPIYKRKYVKAKTVITHPDHLQYNYTVNYIIHREDGPAQKWKRNNAELWYYGGLLHREDGPSVTYEDGTQYWHQDGKLHRLYGPATIIAKYDMSGGFAYGWYYYGTIIAGATLDIIRMAVAGNDQEYDVEGLRQLLDAFDKWPKTAFYK